MTTENGEHVECGSLQEKNQKEHECEYFGKSFGWKGDLSRHVKIIH